MDLFEATPPLETITPLLARAAQSGSRHTRVATVHIERAYFYAPAQRSVFIELPAEDSSDGDVDMVGELRLSLYGTRDAAMNWVATYSEFLTKLGFTMGEASPCNFRHTVRNINLTVHGDDFLIVAEANQVKWQLAKMEAEFEIK